jgi:3-hydroxyisobutyrate dehydrogenase
MTTVAFIGLGAMGSRMAQNLAAAGFSLRVWNRDPAKSGAFAATGAIACASPADAAKGARFVVSIVADDRATRDVMLGAQGVLAGAASGTIILDSSTNTPAMSREIAAAAAAKGCSYLDAPVSGSTPQAQAKELVFIVGGDAAAFEQAKPVLGAMGKSMFRMGGPGTGATVKLLVNMITGTFLAALSEAAQVAEAADVDRDALLAVLGEGPTACRSLKSKLPKMLKRDFSPQFQLELMEKDLRYFQLLAQEVDRSTPVAALVRSQFQAGRRAELGKLDSSAIFLQLSGERPGG